MQAAAGSTSTTTPKTRHGSALLHRLPPAWPRQLQRALRASKALYKETAQLPVVSQM